MTNSNQIKSIGVGFGVMLLKEGKVLLGKRHDDFTKADFVLHGEGTWTMPGGKLHFGESFEDGARREVLEETGIKINSTQIINVNNDLVEDAQFVTIGILCEDFEGEPQVKEPDEITTWEWFELDKLPEPIYFPSAKILKEYQKKFADRSAFSILNPDNYKSFHKQGLKSVFASIPSSLFYTRADISLYILKQNYAPLNPYMNFDYNILNSVAKDKVKIATNNLVERADELWVFADSFTNLSDGVVWEIVLAKDSGKPIKFFELPYFKETHIDIEQFTPNSLVNYYGLRLKDIKWPLVYTALSSKLFYFRTLISKYVLENNHIPLNPFMSFDYFVADRIDRSYTLFGNSKHVAMSDALWVFGGITDGVLAEVKLAKERGRPVKYFKIVNKKEIQEISKDEVEFEEKELAKYVGDL